VAGVDWTSPRPPPVLPGLPSLSHRLASALLLPGESLGGWFGIPLPTNWVESYNCYFVAVVAAASNSCGGLASRNSKDFILVEFQNPP